MNSAEKYIAPRIEQIVDDKHTKSKYDVLSNIKRIEINTERNLLTLRFKDSDLEREFIEYYVSK